MSLVVSSVIYMQRVRVDWLYCITWIRCVVQECELAVKWLYGQIWQLPLLVSYVLVVWNVFIGIMRDDLRQFHTFHQMVSSSFCQRIMLYCVLVTTTECYPPNISFRLLIGNQVNKQQTQLYTNIVYTYLFISSRCEDSSSLEYSVFVYFVQMINKQSSAVIG